MTVPGSPVASVSAPTVLATSTPAPPKLSKSKIVKPKVPKTAKPAGPVLKASMVTEALKKLNERGGSSRQALLKVNFFI